MNETLPEGLDIAIDVPNYNGKADGTATARDPAGNVLHVDTGNWKSANARKRFAKDLAEKIKRPRSATLIENILTERLVECERQAASQQDGDDDGPDPKALLAEMPKDVVRQAEERLHDPKLMRRIVNDVKDLGVAGEERLTAATYLVGVSRLLAKPNAAIVQGTSSSGKTYTVETTASVFPPEAVLFAQSMTAQSLYYMKPGSLRHRFVVAGERSRRQDDETADCTKALREMLSSGKLTKLVPMKDENGRMTTAVIEQDGPIAFIETTTLTEIFDEDLNRCVLLNTDERPEQTKQILVSIAVERIEGRTGDDSIRQVHFAMQRLLACEDARVMIPFALTLADKFPTDRTEARRAFGHTLNIVEAVALLHCRQRQRDPENGSIIATIADYTIARWMLDGAIARTLGKSVSDPAKRFYDRLKAWGPKSPETFTSTDAFDKENYSDQQVRAWLSELASGKIINLIDKPKGKPAVYSLKPDGDVGAFASPLPEPSELL